MERAFSSHVAASKHTPRQSAIVGELGERLVRIARTEGSAGIVCGSAHGVDHVGYASCRETRGLLDSMLDYRCARFLKMFDPLMGMLDIWVKKFDCWFQLQVPVAVTSWSLLFC